MVAKRKEDGAKSVLTRSERAKSSKNMSKKVQDTEDNQKRSDYKAIKGNTDKPNADPADNLNRNNAQMIILVVLGFIMISLLGFFSYKFIGSMQKESDTHSEEEKNKEKMYFDADTKKGVFIYRSAAPEKVEQVRFWVSGKRFKMEFIENGDTSEVDTLRPNSEKSDSTSEEVASTRTTKRWIISPDGEFAYFCYESKKQCTPSVTTVDNYMLRWNQPSSNITQEGRDEVDDCEKIRYEVDKVFDVEGATNPYYIKDVLYCVSDEKVVYQKHTGQPILSTGERGQENVKKFYVAEVEYGVELEEDFFELPYEVEMEQ
jgi:hypothetical protein